MFQLGSAPSLVPPGSMPGLGSSLQSFLSGKWSLLD